ncbi:MAG: TIGR00725 family protein [bacterium]|nr:TIGR00725 family protein [bacterium]
MRKKQIVVIGNHNATEVQASTAYSIGVYVAKKKFALICGGRGGVMESAARGAVENGGLVIGILPDDTFAAANQFCSIVLPTGIGYARNSMNVLAADLVISIGGEKGTLTELAYAWHYGKPIVACSFTGGWSEKLAGTRIDNSREDIIKNAHSLKEVFQELDILSQ